jgi:WD40 repeat protein
VPRFCSALILPVALTALVPAAPVPKALPDATKDRDGYPLPKGATARFGSRPYLDLELSDLAFSADGKKLFSILSVETVRACDIGAGKTLPAIPLKWGDESDDEAAVTSTIAGNRVIWITQPIDRAAPAPPGAPHDPNQIALKAESIARVFDLADGSEVTRIRFTGQVSCDTFPRRLKDSAASADGKYLAVAPRPTGTVAVFDMVAGKRLHTHKLTGADGADVYISPDSKTLYVAEPKKLLRRFELISGKELPEVADTDDWINLLMASADGRRLAVRVWNSRKNEGAKEAEDGYVALHDVAANKPLGKLALGAQPADFGFAGSEVIIVLAARYHPASGLMHTISRWNATTLKREWEVPGPDIESGFCRKLIVSPDGKRFVVTDQQNFVHVYDAGTGKLVVEPYGHGARVSWVGFSPDGKQLTTVARDGVRTWSPTGERTSAINLPELIRGRVDSTLFGEHLVWMALAENGKSGQLVGWDPVKGTIGWRMPVEGGGPDRVLTRDGKKCVGVAWNGAKRLWDVTVYDGPAGNKLHAWTYDKVEKGRRRWWWPMALSADGETLFIGGDGVVGLDVATGKEKFRIGAVGQLKPEQGPAAFPMAVSGDGKRIAVIRDEDERGDFLRVFEIETGKELAAHTLGVVYKPALRVSPSGKQVAVWNMRGTTVWVCDAESSETPMRELVGGSSCATCAAFSPNGANLAVGYHDGTALLWDLAAK